MDKKYHWRLEILWAGEWRTIMESDYRRDLVEYASRCAEDLNLRIVDSLEEVKKNGRRH